MNYKLIFLLSLFGLAMALATISLIPTNIEPIFWLIIFLFCAWLFATKTDSKYFLHGFLLGLVNCVWVTSAHVIFISTYLVHHPAEAAMQVPSQFPLGQRGFMIVVGIGVGIVSGILIGLFSWLASKIFRPKA